MQNLIVGVDEVGTGALAGPVVVCAYSADAYPPEVRDSKKMTRPGREALYDRLLLQATFLHIVMAPAREVRERTLGKVWHTLMRSCLRAATHAGAHEIIVDGNRCVRTRFRHRTLPKADALVPAVSAASVVAKVFRDRLMVELSERHRGYGWAGNVGYGTAEHKSAIERLGPTEEHRYEPQVPLGAREVPTTRTTAPRRSIREQHHPEERPTPNQSLLPLPASPARHPGR